MNAYECNGYKDRAQYLQSLAENLGIDPELVTAAAEILGEDEDFDGLVSNLEDYSSIWLDPDAWNESEYSTDEPEAYSDADPGL